MIEFISNTRSEVDAIEMKRGRLSLQIGAPLVIFVVLVFFALFGSSYLTYERSRGAVESVFLNITHLFVARADDQMKGELTRIDLYASELENDLNKAKGVSQKFIDRSEIASYAYYFEDGTSSPLWSVAKSGVVSDISIATATVRAVRDRSVLGPYLSPKGIPYLVVVSPIQRPQNSIGHFVVVWDLRNFSNFFETLDHMDADLVDGRGKVLLSSPGAPRAFESKDAIDDFNMRKNEVVFTKGTGGQYYLQSSARMSSANLGVIMELPYVRVYEGMSPLVLFILMIIGAIFLVLLLELYILRRWLFSPLEALSEAASGMAKGDLIRWVPVDVDNELGALAQTLNLLAFRLRWSQEELIERIQKATHDAEMKAEETEKLNSFMVNRELKMVELKEQLRACSEGQKKNDDKETWQK